NTYENRQYSNFGCSYQNNLAAQIANPSYLLTPRRMTPSDMANRGAAIGAYQRRGISGEFNSRSEVSYYRSRVDYTMSLSVEADKFSAEETDQATPLTLRPIPRISIQAFCLTGEVA